MKLLSIIVPTYNEGDSVARACDAIQAAMRQSLPDLPLEILFVDDGSADDTYVHLEQLARTRPEVRCVKLAANVGAHMAIRAGLDHCRGDCACFIACDLQDPPEVIPRMMDSLTGSVQLVWAARETRDDRLRDRLFSRAFGWLARTVAKVDVPPQGASMALLGSKAIAAARQYSERNLTLDSLLSGLGFGYAVVPYARRARQVGSSKWTLKKKLKLFADFFVGSTYAPIRAMSYFGIFVAVIGFIYAAIVFANRIWFAEPVPGWTSLILVVLVLGGTQMVMLGIIGEYVWRTLDETRRRPRYVIETIESAAAPDSSALSEKGQSAR